MKFTCSHCFTIDIVKGVTTKKYFTTNKKHNYLHHLTSKKHLKAMEKLSTLADVEKTKCPVCDVVMSNDDYENHRERNKIMIGWMTEDLECKTMNVRQEHHYWSPLIRKIYEADDEEFLTCDEYNYDGTRFPDFVSCARHIQKKRKIRLDC
jgi:hypothetical protein